MSAFARYRLYIVENICHYPRVVRYISHYPERGSERLAQVLRKNMDCTFDRLHAIESCTQAEYLVRHYYYFFSPFKHFFLHVCLCSSNLLSELAFRRSSYLA